MIGKSGFLLCALLFPAAGFAQQNLPDSPHVMNLWAQDNRQPDVTVPGGQSVGLIPAPTSLHLSRKEAEDIALKNNPTISVARLQALASQQVTREVKSSLWPAAVANLTAVDAHDDSRISAGGLNNPIIFERAADGASVSQLITDFGHTTNLVAGARLQSKAQDQNALATRDEILLAVDQAFFNALQAQALLKIAQQTVHSRQLVSDQVSALTKSKLKSELDLSFANVNLSQAKLLELDAENNAQAAIASLSAVLGYPNLQDISLVEETELVAPPAENADHLITEAFNRRPELQALEYQSESDLKLRNAARDEFLPSISALAAIGNTPFGDSRLSSWYGAAGVNVQIPIFNGFLYNAKAREATLHEQAALESILDLRNRIARDVRNAWLNARTAYQRLSVSAQLLGEADRALDLSQTRYKLGLGSIVELSQAQLQQTQAQIGNAQSRYEYRLALATLGYQTGGATVTAVPASPAPKSRIKIGEVSNQYMPSNMGMYQPVSIKDFYFDIQPQTLQVRIVVDYTYPDESVLGKNGSQSGPPPLTAQISGLRYDAAEHAVVYEANGTRTVCAQTEERRNVFGKHLTVKNTGACDVTTGDAVHPAADGWRIHRGQTLNTYFEVH
ncbi:MAG TPA: TolC family protein [Terriglobales bacterium]|nr:TolC family protein [Terriglobales bacterium]